MTYTYIYIYIYDILYYTILYYTIPYYTRAASSHIVAICLFLLLPRAGAGEARRGEL